jgi:hypothetical protein
MKWAPVRNGDGESADLGPSSTLPALTTVILLAWDVKISS